MKASEAIVVLMDDYWQLELNKEEIKERLSGGEMSREVIDFGRDPLTHAWVIMRTRHAGDDRAEQAAKEL